MDQPLPRRSSTPVGTHGDVEEVDALVVGGGPAGCAVAIVLRRLGRSVLLMDRRDGAIAKTCGHCLSSRGLLAMRRIGLAGVVESVTESQQRALRIDVEGRSMRVAIPAGGAVVRRDRLDPALQLAARRAGADVRCAARLVSMTSPDHSGRRTVTCVRGGVANDVRTALVVGADGLGSAVARFSELASAGTHRDGAVGVSFDVERGSAGWCSSFWSDDPDDCSMVRMVVGAAGYVGFVPERAGRLHGAAMVRPLRNGRVDVRAAMRDILRDRASASAIARLRLVGAGPMPWRPPSVARAGVALVGDAAGYVEPFTGEGMTWAIESAIALGESIEAARSRSLPFDEHVALDYARRWRRVIGSAQSRCAMVGWLLRRPGLLAATAAACPSLTRGIGSAIARAMNRSAYGETAVSAS